MGLCRAMRMGAIPQGFRRRFVRGRSRPTSANPLSRSESAISAPYNRQRHLGSSSSTTTCSPETLLTRPKPSSGGGGFLLFGVPGAGFVVEGAVSQAAVDADQPVRNGCEALATRSEDLPGLRSGVHQRSRRTHPAKGRKTRRGWRVGTPATGGHSPGARPTREDSRRLRR